MPQFGPQALFGRHQFGTFTRLGLSSLFAPKTAAGAFSARGYYLINGTAAKSALPGDTILTNFGRFVRGVDMATQAIKNAVEGAITNWNLKVYLSDGSDPPRWVDLTDQAEWRGKNMLRTIGRLEYSAERRVGGLQQRMANVVFDNSDGFWSRPWVEDAGNGSGWTSKIRASFDSNWNFLNDKVTSPGANPSAASTSSDTRWYLSQNGEQTALFHHKIALRAEFQVMGGTVENVILGVFIIEKKAVNGEAQTCTLTLAPFSKALTEGKKAETVKEGAGWYRNRNTKFLVEELLKKEYAIAGGGLPTSWEIEDTVDFDVPLSERERWVASHFGRPPERTVNAELDPTGNPSWVSEPAQVCRATTASNYETGTISVTPGSAVVTGTGTLWETGPHPPREGDAFVIPREFTSGDGGSTLGHNGKFVVASIDSETSITLTGPLQGSAVEASLAYSVPRLYLGVGGVLYEYNITTDTYYKLGTAGVDNSNIIRIWANPSDSTYPIWGVAVPDLTVDTGIVETMDIFRFRWNGVVTDGVTVYHPVVDKWGSGVAVFSGQWICREADHYGTGHTGKYQMGYYGSGNTRQPPVTTPFPQVLANARSTSNPNWRIQFPEDRDIYTSKYSSDFVGDGDDYSELTIGTNQRHWHIRNISSSDHEQPFTMRYSSGQDGCIILNPNAGTNGAIFYANTTLPTADTDHDDDTAPEYDFEFKHILLSQSDPGGGVPATVTVTDAFDDLESTDYTVGYLPTAGCAHISEDVFYIAVTRYTQGNTQVGNDGIQSAILAYDLSTGLAVEKYRFPEANEEIFTELISTENNLWAVSFNPKAVGTDLRPVGDNYFVSAWEYGASPMTPSVDIYTVYQTQSIIQGLVAMDHVTMLAAGEDDANKIYFQEPTRGLIQYVEDSEAVLDLEDQTPTVVSRLPAAPGDTYILHNQVAVIESLKELYWISSSAPFFVAPNRAEGRFYLSKWSPSWPARIELADFGGMSLWSALNIVADVVGAKFGFNADGTFFFKKLPRHKTPVYTFTNMEASRLLSVSRDEGYDDVANEAVRIPFSSGPGDVGVHLTLGPDSKAEEYTLDVIVLTEKSVTAKLFCEIGGDADTAEWSYLIIRGTVNTSLIADYAKDALSVSLSDPLDMTFGMFLTAKGIDTSNNEVSLTTNVGALLKYSAGTLTIDTNLSENGHILSVSGSFNMTSAADEISHSLAVGDIILVANFGTASDYEYMQITSVSATELGVSRGFQGTKSVFHAAGQEVAILRSGNKVFLSSKLADTGGVSTALLAGDSVLGEFPDSNRWSRSLIANPTDPGSGYLPVTAWKGSQNNYVPIGDLNGPYGTGLSLRLVYTGEGDAARFRNGDLITISSPGIMLTEEASSISIYNNLESQARFGKRVDDSGDSFLSIQTAGWKTRQIVQDRAWPKYRFTVQSILTPWVLPLDVVSIQDETLLPRADEFKTSAYVSSMSFDLMTGGLQTLSLKAIDAH